MRQGPATLPTLPPHIAHRRTEKDGGGDIGDVMQESDYLLPLGPFSGLASLAKTELVVDPTAFAFLSCFGFFFSLFDFI